MLTGNGSCVECDLDRYLLATIHDSLFPGGALTNYPRPHATADGRFFITDGSRLYVTDTTGAVVQQVGREGEGPGEYDRPRVVVDMDTSFAVMDPNLGRITILDTPGLDLIRTVPMPASYGGTLPVIFPDGAFVMSTDIATRERVGLPLHLVSPGGEIIRSFGEEGAERPRGLAASGDSAFWAFYPLTYRLDLWSRSGRLLLTLQREADWWAHDEEAIEPGDRYTILLDVYEDEDGLLWTHTQRSTRTSWGGNEASPDANESIVEVIDPSSARVLVSRRFEKVFQFGVSNRFYHYTRAFAANGGRIVRIWNYRLHRGRDFQSSR